MNKKALCSGCLVVALLELGFPIRADEIAWKNIIGADKHQLSDSQIARVAKILNKVSNTYGCKGTLAQCIAKGDLTARRHGGFVARMVKKNKDDQFIEKYIALRHESSHPDEIANIDLSNAPSTGSPEAEVKVVEYACFECPFCAHLAPELKKLRKRFAKKISFYYKYFPVISHPRGVPAAKAAVAAYKQHKFWPMYDLLFAHRTDLKDGDLLEYAKKAGLNIDQWQRDKDSQATLKAIEKDKLEGMRFGVEGTPTFFINGKMFQSVHDYEELADRIDEELDIAENRIK
jgi:protein-disulfide isomerase